MPGPTPSQPWGWWPTWSINPACSCPGVLSSPPRLVLLPAGSAEEPDGVVVRCDTHQLPHPQRGSFLKQRLLRHNTTLMSPTARKPSMTEPPQCDHTAMTSLQCTLPHPQVFYQVPDRPGMPCLRAVLPSPAAKPFAAPYAFASCLQS